ncbi:MAG: DUF6320 domain-containing protein [Anaeromassilibacillus sp.]
MKYCAKCKTTVTGHGTRCPLCQGMLQETGTADTRGDVFPRIPDTLHKHSLFFRILILVSVVAAVTCVVINLILPQHGWWSLFVLAGLACAWISLAVAFHYRRNVPKSILYQVVVVCVLTVLWDYSTGWHGWSIDYVIPITCVVAMLVLAITARVFKLNLGSFIVYFTIAALFAIVPVVFYVRGMLQVVYPSLICVAGSVISLAALILFEGDNMRKELKRRLHL